MNERTIKWEILGALKDLRDNGPQYDCGICGEVLYRFEDCPGIEGPSQDILRTIMQQWPEYSGNDEFPVPAPPCFSPARHSAFHAFYDLDRWTGPYGDTRRRLLAYAIAKLEAELQEQGAAHE